MNTTRFDYWARSLSRLLSRRAVLGFSGASLGLAAMESPSVVEAKKNRRKKLSFNEYGCVNVGQACRGNSDNCCSGICQGKKPKKGTRDKSRCVAHDVLGCQVDQDQCAGTPASCGSTPFGLCYRTTGKTGYCGVSGGCLDCRTDADCVAHGGFGQDAACVVCPDCPGAIETACFAAAP